MRPVIIFGLDGATYTVLDDLVARGIMPTLAEFMRTGVRGTLESVTPPLTPPAWTTLVTGRTPGNHGITGFFQYESADSTTVQIVGSRQISTETIWSMANRHGARSGCLNFVAHNPAPKIDGWVIPGWTSWRWMRQLSHPANLIDSLKGDIPGFDLKILAMDYEQERKAIVGADSDEYAGWVDLHIAREKQWFAVMKHLMQREPAQLAGIVFDGVDKLQHLLWPFLDPRLTPEQPGADFLRTREMAWNYFRTIDDLLKQAMELHGGEATILICSDHGFTNSWEVLFINTWLEKNGYLTWLPEAEEVTNPTELEPSFYQMTNYDMERTKAYALTTSSNGIFINIKGGRGAGGIDPADYDRFRAELAHRILNEIVDPETGEKIVTKITFREDAFAGPKMSLAPDLTLQLRDYGFVSVRKYDKVLAKRSQQMGTHHPDGILIANGPGVRKGAAIANTRLIDIAPTALFAMGLPVPTDLQGSVIEAMFTADYLRDNQAGRSGTTRTMAAAVGAAEPAGEDDDDILNKMRALGYIE
jgi:predicted AlkP superfamily phosphohydrolase/phosphomutase